MLILFLLYKKNENFNNDKPCALLIPIHEKHFNYIYDLIAKIENELPLYLIFSDQEQLDKFKMKDKIIPFIYSEKSNSIVTDKKFYGLKNLINSNHEYIIVCDAEIDIIPENFNINNIMKKINEIFNNKKIYGGAVNKNDDKLNNIIISSSSVFKNNDDKQKLINIIKPNENYIYTWWSDLPVYKKDHLIDFFNKIELDNYNWNHFDNMIYNNYLLLYHNFELININPILNINDSLESYNTNDINNINKLENIKYGFSWISKGLFNNFKDILINKGSFLIYHLDR